MVKKKTEAKKKTETEKVIDAAESMTEAVTPAIQYDPEWDFENFERASSEIWRPDEGEYVMGHYDGCVMLDKELTEFDEDVNVHFIIDKDSKNRVSFVGGKMCDKFISESPIQSGTKVFIRYMGQGSTRKGNKVNNYDIRFQA
jgi:hypothetical protein